MHMTHSGISAEVVDFFPVIAEWVYQEKQTTIIDRHTEKLERDYKIQLHLTLLPAPNSKYTIPQDSLFLEDTAPAQLRISACLEQTFCTYEQHLNWRDEKSRAFIPHNK